MDKFQWIQYPLIEKNKHIRNQCSIILYLEKPHKNTAQLMYRHQDLKAESTV